MSDLHQNPELRIGDKGDITPRLKYHSNHSSGLTETPFQCPSLFNPTAPTASQKYLACLPLRSTLVW